MLKARVICDFKAVKNGQIHADEGEEVTILSVNNGYVQIEKPNGETGEIPNYFLEMSECPGDTFADQIKYRRKWYSLVDSKNFTSNIDLGNPIEFLRELPKAPELSIFAQVEKRTYPLFSTQIPLIREDLKDVTIKVGSPIKLICRFSSETKVLATWKIPNGEFKDGKVETNEHSSTLVIPKSNISDAGQYILTLKNEQGKCTSLCWVTIITLPGTPQDFLCENLPNNVIMLKWTAPTQGNSHYLWYTVEYKRQDMEDYEKAIYGITQRAIRISQLQPMTYSFRVYAFNEFFCGVPSKEVVVNMSFLSKNFMQISLD